MKKLLFILSFLIAFSSYSQNNDGVEICLQYQKSLKSFISDKEAEDALNKILNVIGASRNFLLVSCDEISNALAITFKGERYILYDKDFIDKIEDMTNDWSGLFILAHEIGHHINGHTRDFLLAEVLDEQSKEKQREEELEADEFAGFIVANLGAKYNEVSELLDLIGSDTDDSYSTHPNKDKRREAVKKGFDKIKTTTVVKNNTKNTNLRNKSTLNTSAGSWSYKEKLFPSLYYANKRQSLNDVLDPFDRVEIEKRIPITTRISSTIGRSYKDEGSEDIELIIEQNRYTHKYGRDFGYMKTLNEEEQKIMPYKEIKISLKGFLDMPKFLGVNYKDFYDIPEYKKLEEELGIHNIAFRDKGTIYQVHPSRLEDFLNDFPGAVQISQNIPGIMVIVRIIIDDIWSGEFEGEFGGWEVDVDMEQANKLKKLGKYDRLWENNGVLQVLNPEDVDLSRNLYGDKNANGVKHLLSFMDALKKGNKMYLRLDRKIASPKTGMEFVDDKGLLDIHTYEFDLKGSSKALNFN